MNIVMRNIYATTDFIIINIAAVSIHTIPDPLTLAWYSLCVLLAYALRLGMEYKKNNLTGKVLLYQSICTVGWCFFMVQVWYDFLDYDRGFEIYLFLNSLFSTFLVSQFEDAFEMGVRKWLKSKINWIIAEDKEVKP